MSPAIKEEITKLLKQAADLAAANNQRAPYDYGSLRERIVLLEVRREVAALRGMLESNNFAEQFKERCRWRATNTEANIKFSELPKSKTNQLYWDIATLVFKPKTMAEMVEIILPQVTICLEITFPEEKSQSLHPTEVKKYFKDSLPVLKKNTLANTLKCPPEIDEPGHYIIIETLLFNVNDISHFSLKLHAWFQNYLTNTNLALAAKVYNHNTHLQCLATNILTYKHKGVTPRAAIEQLIKHLILGGSRITTHKFASPASTQSLNYFFAYFNALPSELQIQLRALNIKTKTLGNIIDVEIQRGQCTETTADLLSQILDAHKHNPILNLPPQMNVKDLKKIESQYGSKAPVDTSPNDSPLITFPTHLLKIAIQDTTPANYEELVILLLNFPPQLYDMLWEHIQVNTGRLDQIGEAIKSGFFNIEQRQALAKAIVKHRHRLELQQQILIWAILTHELIFVEEALTTYDDPVAAIKTVHNSQTALHFATSSLPILKTLLTIIPSPQRFAALTFAGNLGRNVLQQNKQFPEILTTLLKLLPADKIEAAVLAKNNQGINLIHFIAEHPDSMRAVLNLLDPSQKLTAIKSRTTSGGSLLHLLKTHYDCFKMALELHPGADEKLEAVMAVDNTGLTVLHATSHKPQSLLAVLNVIPDLQKLDAIKKLDNKGESVLYKAIQHPKSLKIVLEIIPQEQRLAMLKTVNKSGTSALSLVGYSLEYAQIIIELLPEELRGDVLKAEISLLSSLLSEDTRANFAMVRNILQLVPEKHRLGLLTYKHPFRGPVINCLATRPENTKDIILLLPLAARNQAVRLLDFTSYLSFIIHFKDVALFEELVRHSGENQMVSMLNESDADGYLLLYTFVKSPALLKILLKFAPNYFKLKENKEIKTALVHSLDNSESIKLILEPLSRAKKLEVVKVTDAGGDTLLHKCRFYDHSITTILELLPELERLEIVQIKDKAGSSLLSMTAHNFDFAHKLLLLLPGEHRLEAVLARDSQNKSIFSRCASSPDKLRIILSLLPEYPRNPSHKPVSHGEILKGFLSLVAENNRLSLLKTAITKQNVMDFFIENRITILLSDPGFKDSFVPDFMTINEHLVARANSEQGTMSFFRTRKSAKALLAELFKANNFETFKANLIAYFDKNLNSPLTNELLIKLVQGSNKVEVMLEQLKQKWIVRTEAPALIMNP